MKKLTLIALSLLVAAFIGCGKTDARPYENHPSGNVAQENNVNGESTTNEISFSDFDPNEIYDLAREVLHTPSKPEPKEPVNPNAPKDYFFEDVVRDIPYVTDDGKNRTIAVRRRLQEVKSLSDEIQFKAKTLLEQASDFKEAMKEAMQYGVENGQSGVLGQLGVLGVGLFIESMRRSVDDLSSGLRQYEEKMRELPDEIEWKDEYIEKIRRSRITLSYMICKDDLSTLETKLLDVNSSPIDILDFMERELVPYVKDHPNTVLYQNFQQSLRDYCELIADSEITSKYPKVATRPFLNRLKTIGDTYNVELSVELPKADVISVEASLWKPSSSREAGTRQTLKIGDAEYGFVWIPAGEFDMGSPESEKDRDDEEVLHHVKLTKGFWMLETEVTQALYLEIMEKNPSKFKRDDRPVDNVSWNDAMMFCSVLTTRLSGELKASLPTEAQWEYSCRAGTKTAYWYGDAEDSSKMNRANGTTSVKSYDPNPWGLYDMHGNVWEWTSDYYGEYPKGTVVDPKGPSDASDRVVRGGSWGANARSCRSAFRSRSSSGDRYSNLGFRFLLSCD